MRFGISTHLYHGERLARQHLSNIAEAGFTAIELVATGSHFDYHDHLAIENLARWLDDLRLELHSVHAPAAERYRDGRPAGLLSTAAADLARRSRAVSEAAGALEIVRRIPAHAFVLHLSDSESSSGTRGGGRAAAVRTIVELADLADGVGVALAFEVIPNTLSTPGSLVELLEDELELPNAGICLDFGHALLMDDPVNAVETASGHLLTTHVHDNRGTRDEHLVPFEGSIDWPHVLMALRKIGYDGMLLFEVANTGDSREVLERAGRARTRFEQLLNG